jgi:hypothetical protein
MLYFLSTPIEKKNKDTLLRSGEKCKVQDFSRECIKVIGEPWFPELMLKMHRISR